MIWFMFVTLGYSCWLPNCLFLERPHSGSCFRESVTEAHGGKMSWKASMGIAMFTFFQWFGDVFRTILAMNRASESWRCGQS